MRSTGRNSVHSRWPTTAVRTASVVPWRRCGHELDAVAGRVAHERARRAPVLVARLRMEARVAQCGERRVVVVDYDRVVAVRRHHGVVGQHQVHLGAIALDPRRAVGERRRRVDAAEADELVEAHTRVHVGTLDFDADVLKHGNRNWNWNWAWI